MIIEHNGFKATVRDFNGELAIKVSDLIQLSGHHFTMFYRRLRNEFKYDKYIRKTTHKDTCLTLEGCVKILQAFREPNDALIKKIKELQGDVETVSDKKQLAEKVVDFELNNNKLEGRVSLLEVKTNDMMVSASLSESHFQDCITKIDDRLMDIENSLSYLNDKPNQQDTSFRKLLKECIKEIIKEELQQ